MKPGTTSLLVLVSLAVVALGAPAADAQHYVLERDRDGVILIHHETAFAGALPGDAPGFPITIGQPGSYRLISNIVVPDANTTAIEIAASHVTLDLNGFAILGPTVCVGAPTVTGCDPTGAGVGVRSSPPATNITVRNGTVSGMGATGVAIETGRVERIHASGNGGNGIVIGQGAALYNTATRNRFFGLSTTTATVLGNVASGNSAGGLGGVSTSGAGHNVFHDNGSDAIVAIQTAGNVCGGALCP
jgi:hypothetical protein